MTPLDWLGRKTTAQTNKLPTALDGTLWNKLTLVFYEFMKKKREHFCPEFAQLRMFFHTYEVHFCLLITNWYVLRFKLSVEFVKHAFRLWFLLIFYDEVYRWQISPPCLGSRQIILNPTQSINYRHITGLGGSVGCAVRLEIRRSRVQPPPRSATFFRGDWSWNIFYDHSLPSADSRRAVVSFWRKNAHNTD